MLIPNSGVYPEIADSARRRNIPMSPAPKVPATAAREGKMEEKWAKEKISLQR
jgi:hypothetical protein